MAPSLVVAAFSPVLAFQRSACRSVPLYALNKVVAETVASGLLLSSSSPTATTEFAPVLNVPALGVFLFVGLVFGALQIRVKQIQAAVSDRTTALEDLRELKRQSLEEPQPQLDDALLNYELAYRKVENLRTIMPGINLRALINQRTVEENERAAQQFLKISSTTSSSVEPEPDGATSSIALAVLAVIGVSQIILLFVFATLNDPARMTAMESAMNSL